MNEFKNEPELLKIALNIWYHDDGALVDKVQNMDAIANAVSRLSNTLGLALNTTKTKIYSMSDHECKFECTRKYKLNFEIVGSFIGDERSTLPWLDEKLEKYKRILDTIKVIPNPQIQLSYLYYSSQSDKTHLFSGNNKYTFDIQSCPL